MRAKTKQVFVDLFDVSVSCQQQFTPAASVLSKLETACLPVSVLKKKHLLQVFVV
jgi:hypothetical protein